MLSKPGSVPVIQLAGWESCEWVESLEDAIPTRAYYVNNAEL